MGGGGRMSAPTSKGEEKKSSTLQRVPYSKPSFTLGDIKKAIPPHCFERSLIRSFSYVAYDLLAVFLVYYVATSYFHLLRSPYCYVAWPVYWVLQGCVCTGVWVIAHECGHHAFSDYQWVDDMVGLILHSALLVPYFSWKYSHRRHHSNTGSLERDEVFVPKPKSEVQWYSKYLNNPPGRVITLAITLTLGWPLYLAFNVSGREKSGTSPLSQYVATLRQRAQETNDTLMESSVLVGDRSSTFGNKITIDDEYDDSENEESASLLLSGHDSKHKHQKNVKKRILNTQKRNV